ncbi:MULTISPECIES: hypothetical protein, partial [Gammaproteobacteria]
IKKQGLVRKPLAKFSHPESISGRCGGKNCCDFKPKSNLTHNKLVVRPHEKIAFVGPVLLIFEPWWEKCSFSQSEAAM